MSGSPVAALLARTLTRVLRAPVAGVAPALELVVGGAAPQSSARTVAVGVAELRLEVRDGPTTTLGGRAHRIVELWAACYGAAAALYRALELELAVPLRLPIEIDLAALYGVAAAQLAAPVELGSAMLVGAGAIGNAVLLGLSAFDARGELAVCDPDAASDGNLNRCWWFDAADLGEPKAERLVRRAQATLPGLHLVPHVQTLHDAIVAAGGAPPRTLIVGVDSRRARRSLQTELPHTVFDASTTGITEVVFHANRLPSDLACLACVYHEAADETAHEAHVAEALGVTVADVRTNFVSAEAARAIAATYPHLQPAELEGLAYDSLFKALCGAGELKTRAAERVLAPFAFVSVLAGVVLALEIAVRTRGGGAVGAAGYNAWYLSPWGAPVARRRERRAKRPDCEFCSNPILQEVAKRQWG